MFLRSRRRIVISVMVALVLLLTVTLGTIYGSSYLSLKKQNEEMLERYVGMYSLEAQPDMAPPTLPPREGGEMPRMSDGALYQLSSFYSAALAEDGTILAVDTGNNGLYGEEDIAEKAREVLKSGKKTGSLNNMLFQADHREDYSLVAFMDNRLMENSMSTLFFHTLFAGIIAMVLIFGLSVVLARRIIRPLEENDRRQRQFISDAGHELKTPVSVISANADLLERQEGENRWLSNIIYENDRMGQLVKDLLDLSRAGSDARPFEEIDFSRLVGQELLPFESMAFEHGLLIVSKVQEGIRVKGDPQRLGQLLSILIDNAISHSTGGGEIHILLKKRGKQALLSLTNPGEEIEEESRERLFDRFYRLDQARSGEDGHFGLGLPIARAITEAHGGKISLDWREGRVICRLTLPTL